MKNKNIVLFMMGGSGTRFGEKVPKQFTVLGTKPIFIQILKQLNRVKVIDEIVIITHPDYLEYTSNMIKDNKIKKIVKIITGGNGRSKDILAAMEEVKDTCNAEDNVLMYDATHPFVDVKGFTKVVEMIDKYRAATLAEFQYDTTYIINEEDKTIENVIPRTKIIAGASPEGFKFGEIYDIYKKTPADELNNLTSAGAIALANNIEMYVVETEIPNLKITYKKDMEIVRQLSDYYFD